MKEKPLLTTRRMRDWRWTDGRDELFGLDDMCKKFLQADSRVLEIGSNIGTSTSLFAYYADNVVCVDVVCTNELSDVQKKFGNIEVKVGLSVEQVPLLENHSFDLVYIDADHSYAGVVQDIAVSILKVKPNGIISGHDYCEKYHNPVFTAVNDYIKSGVLHSLQTYGDTSWSASVSDAHTEFDMSCLAHLNR